MVCYKRAINSQLASKSVCSMTNEKIFYASVNAANFPQHSWQ